MKRVALITGGSAGIGLASAFRLALDHVVVIASSNPERLEQARSELARKGLTAEFDYQQLDVRNRTSVEAAVDKVVQRHGQIDVLVNSAGVGGGGRTVEIPEPQWQNIIDTNLNGVIRVTDAVLKRAGMLERHWGRIVNIASTGGKQGVMFASAYSASKHGVVGFSKSLGLELAKSGITVNAVCPGFVETSMAERARQGYAKVWGCDVAEAKRRIEERIPLGRYVQPDEVSALVAYLVSDGAAAIIGQAMNVCGGLGNY